jgi:serine/threonine protein kinase
METGEARIRLGQWIGHAMLKRSRHHETWQVLSARHHAEGVAKCSRRSATRLGHDVELFFEEALTTASLGMSSVPAPLAMGVADDTPYIVYPRVKATSLRQLLVTWAGAEQSRSERTVIAGALIAVVRAIHSRCVFHRDIKPENVLVGREHQVYLIDWDLAHAPILRPGARYKGAHTPRYSPPERRVRRIHSGEADDVYALGVTLLEVLGEQPSQSGDLPGNVSTAGSARCRRAVLALVASDPDERIAAFRSLAPEVGVA